MSIKYLDSELVKEKRKTAKALLKSRRVYDSLESVSEDKYRMDENAIKAAEINILSAKGSISCPKRVTRPKRRAKYPSRKSVRPANKNITKAAAFANNPGSHNKTSRK